MVDIKKEIKKMKIRISRAEEEEYNQYEYKKLQREIQMRWHSNWLVRVWWRIFYMDNIPTDGI